MVSITEAAAGAVGKVREAVMALTGYPGIFHHLAGEHAETAVRLSRIARTDNPRTRRAMFDALRIELLSHMHAEEEEFYPQVERLSDLETQVQPLISQCLEDHRRIAGLIVELDATDAADPSWPVGFAALKAVVEQHVDREEQELFAAVRDSVDSDSAHDLLDDYAAVERRERQAL